MRISFIQEQLDLKVIDIDEINAIVKTDPYRNWETVWNNIHYNHNDDDSSSSSELDEDTVVEAVKVKPKIKSARVPFVLLDKLSAEKEKWKLEKAVRMLFDK